jgi:hypothetical protein
MRNYVPITGYEMMFLLKNMAGGMTGAVNLRKAA